jgi:nicotinamidase-related amidase
LVRKRFFSAFGSGELDPLLRRLGADTLVIAGIYLHGCIRSTVLDAYERGYAVRVADDAVASADVEHARISRDYLNGRAATFVPVASIVATLPGGVAAPQARG